MRGKTHIVLDSAEWDFPTTLAGQHLTACLLYEYARESNTLRTAAAEIRALRKKEWRELCKQPSEPRLVWRGKRLRVSDFLMIVKDADIQAFYTSCSDIEAKALERSFKRYDEYEVERKKQRQRPLFHEAAEAVFRQHRIKSAHYQNNLEFIVKTNFFPDTPWQRLTQEQQDSVIKYPVTCRPLAPGNLHELNAVYSAIPQCQKEQAPKDGTPASFMWPNYSCHPYVIEDGRETRPFTIDWAGSSDKEVCDAFSQWVVRRREQVGIHPPRHRQLRRSVNPPGRGNDDDLKSHLYHLGVMRVLNLYSIKDVCRLCPAAWRQWVWRETEKTPVETDRPIFLRAPDAFLVERPSSVESTMTFRRILIERRRGSAREVFRTLFPFERKPPVHWARCG